MQLIVRCTSQEYEDALNLAKTLGPNEANTYIDHYIKSMHEPIKWEIDDGEGVCLSFDRIV